MELEFLQARKNDRDVQKTPAVTTELERTYFHLIDLVFLCQPVKTEWRCTRIMKVAGAAVKTSRVQLWN